MVPSQRVFDAARTCGLADRMATSHADVMRNLMFREALTDDNGHTMAKNLRTQHIVKTKMAIRPNDGSKGIKSTVTVRKASAEVP